MVKMTSSVVHGIDVQEGMGHTLHNLPFKKLQTRLELWVLSYNMTVSVPSI